MRRIPVIGGAALFLLLLIIYSVSFADHTPTGPGTPLSNGWLNRSSANGYLTVDGPLEQTASLVLDIDNDGLNDFVIGGREQPPALVWFQRGSAGWASYVIEDQALSIEAGGAFFDIDSDGDLDIAMGGDHMSNQVWWWENPYPSYRPGVPWTRHLIKSSGAKTHHDMIFGDFDGDHLTELVFWNQGANKLMLAEIPADPRTSGPWSFSAIFSATELSEGLAGADIDGDGRIDLIGGGRWFKHLGGTSFRANLIDPAQAFGRAAVGQLRAGGRPEVVFVAGDGVGRLKWYEWRDDQWVGHDLLGVDVDHGHSLQITDIDHDGSLDIFCAEMRLDGDNPESKMWVFFGDGQGSFRTTEIARGYGNHESRVADLDGDGDLDILGKPYNWQTPRVDIWLNTGARRSGRSLDSWERHVIDPARPSQAVFVAAGDLDGDRLPDVAAGGYWYRNPGTPGGAWVRGTIGAPLNNLAAIFDADGDGDMDVLGTEGQGAAQNANFVWARNDGQGTFSILDNIAPGDGDFLQGVARGPFAPGGAHDIALSWHAGGKGVQALTVPDAPSTEQWAWRTISAISQDEALSAGDIDRDGDSDLLLGTIWLEHTGEIWDAHTLGPLDDLPDRNRLADINRDGRLDAVVGFEAISAPGKLAWYEQGARATDPWAEHVIATVTGPMSLDVQDMDDDGDMDVVVGEHNLNQPSSAKLYIFENLDGLGGSWDQHVVYTGDEHHDGAQVVDIDNDGDFDVISIGWSHGRVIVYENTAVDGAGSVDQPKDFNQYLPLVTE